MTVRCKIIPNIARKYKNIFSIPDKYVSSRRSFGAAVEPQTPYAKTDPEPMNFVKILKIQKKSLHFMQLFSYARQRIVVQSAARRKS